MRKQLKPIPEFKNEQEEREFWENHSSMNYVDWDNAERVTFSNLKPSALVIEDNTNFTFQTK